MHHTPAQIPTGISLLQAKKLPTSQWFIPGQEDNDPPCSSRLAYLHFMDQWRWLALNGND